MPKYVISAVNPEGRKITEQFEASTSGNAIRELQRRGYTDVKLETEDIIAIVNQEFETITKVNTVDRFATAKDYVAFSKMRGLSRFIYGARKIRPETQPFSASNVVIVVVSAVIVIYFKSRKLLDRPVTEVDKVVLVVLGAVFLGAILYPILFGAARRYNKLIEAISWYRFEEVLKWIPMLKGSIPPFDLALYEGAAWSGLGQIDRGLKLVAPFENDEKIPKWYYWSRLSAIYWAAGQPAKILECYFKALEYEPNQAVVLIDYANGLVRFKKDVAQAREMMARIDPVEVTDLMHAFLETVAGQIALEEKQFEAAVEHFQASLQRRSKVNNNPLIQQSIDIHHGYLALAYAGLGQMQDAREHFTLAEPRLKALTISDLLQRCQRAIGTYAS